MPYPASSHRDSWVFSALFSPLPPDPVKTLPAPEDLLQSAKSYCTVQYRTGIWSRWWHRNPLDPKKSPARPRGGVRPVSSRFFTGIPGGDGVLLAQLGDQGSGRTWYMQHYCLRRHPAPISCSSSSEHDRRRNRAGTCSQQPGQVAVPLPQTTAEREGPRHPPLWLQPRARLRWTERSQWLFLARPVALVVALVVALALALRWPMRCTALCSPLPYIQYKPSTTLSPASPSPIPILLHPSQVALLCAVLCERSRPWGEAESLSPGIAIACIELSSRCRRPSIARKLPRCFASSHRRPPLLSLHRTNQRHRKGTRRPLSRAAAESRRHALSIEAFGLNGRFIPVRLRYTCRTTSFFSRWIPRRLTRAHFATKSHAADRLTIGFSVFAQPTVRSRFSTTPAALEN